MTGARRCAYCGNYPDNHGMIGGHDYEPSRVTPDDPDCDCIQVVESWLYDDSRGFVIPGTQWGRDLKQSLEHVLALALSHDARNGDGRGDEG